MIGAVAGDIIGSVYEAHPVKTTDFPLFSARSCFTDDTVMTVATADCIINNREYAGVYREYGRRYPHAGYGSGFRRWLFSEASGPYNSYGNGSAMRVSPVGFAFPSMEEVMAEAKKSAEVTHNHPEGIKGAQAAAAAVYLARQGKSRGDIKEFIERTFSYDLDRRLDSIRKTYRFDPSCQGTVPEAIIAFLESGSFEEAVRNAVSLGGDSDTLACITGAVAEAFYRKIPPEITEEARKRLTPDLLDVVDRFAARYT